MNWIILVIHILEVILILVLNDKFNYAQREICRITGIYPFPKNEKDCPVCGRKGTRCGWGKGEMKCSAPCGAIQIDTGRVFLGPDFIGYDEYRDSQEQENENKKR